MAYRQVIGVPLMFDLSFLSLERKVYESHFMPYKTMEERLSVAPGMTNRAWDGPVGHS